MAVTTDTQETEAIGLAILSLEGRARRSRNEGLIYVVLILIVAVSIVLHFGTFAVETRIVNVKAEQTNIASGIHIDQIVGWPETIKDSILRFGAVLLAIYLIQILVSFARYRFRISDALFSRALALRIGGPDPEKLSIYSQYLSTELIEYGSLPKYPYEEAFRTLKDIGAKISKRDV
jgi:hypothetical protein